MSEWQRARLIPVSGIGSEREAEMRAASAVLAVIEAVRSLSVAVLAPLGASRAARAEVRCFTEIPFKGKSGDKRHRPDGLIQVTYGKTSWTTLVEMKTGTARLDADQINAYWDLARDHDFDAVLTISNEISASADVHPTPGLKARSNSKVQVHHLSWSALLSTCEVLRDHRGVEDPEQAWILHELIRYLSHPSSGVTAFDDMGPEWVMVRDGARDGVLKRSDGSVQDVAQRWDQLLRFAALRLEASIGQPVTQALPVAQRDPQKRVAHLVDRVIEGAQLDGTLRIPNTVGDLELIADLKARRITASVEVSAPEDRGGRARCTWLLNQLNDEVDGRLTIEAFAKNARNGTMATVGEFRESKDILLGDDRKDPFRFRLSVTREMGVSRKTGKKTPGFIDSVLALITDFYGTVIQDLKPWTPSAPKISAAANLPTEGLEPRSPHEGEVSSTPQPAG